MRIAEAKILRPFKGGDHFHNQSDLASRPPKRFCETCRKQFGAFRFQKMPIVLIIGGRRIASSVRKQGGNLDPPLVNYPFDLPYPATRAPPPSAHASAIGISASPAVRESKATTIEPASLRGTLATALSSRPEADAAAIVPEPPKESTVGKESRKKCTVNLHPQRAQLQLGGHTLPRIHRSAQLQRSLKKEV